jgi:predicted DNA-binding protein (MmcQ/YjbR family)
MDIEAFCQYCMHKTGAEETTPFGPDTLVFKVGEKIFAITSLDDEECSANLKCDPEYAEELRVQYPDVIIPGYHMNKKHWNTVYLSAGLPDKLITKLIDHSYVLVVESLPAKVRSLLQ